MRRRRRRTTVIKSNNPHLAGGEKLMLFILFWSTPMFVPKFTKFFQASKSFY